MTITLNSYILADGIAADQTAKTDARGKVVFDNLTAGIYLVSSVRTEQDGKYYVFESFLAAVPGVDSEGQWVYSVSARPKMSVHTPAKGEVTYKAVKAWRDGGQDRPVSVSVEVRRDGQLQQSVTLSAENNWMYTWKAVDDGSVWTVNEVNVPEGYTVGIQRSGDTFSITNTKPETPAGNHPQTGDTTNMTLYVLLMAASGLALLVVGIVHTGLVYILFFSAVGRLPAQTTAVLSYVDPVTAILLATLFLHQPFGLAEACGTVLILGATLANELPGNKTAEAQS